MRSVHQTGASRSVVALGVLIAFLGALAFVGAYRSDAGEPMPVAPNDPGAEQSAPSGTATSLSSPPSAAGGRAPVVAPGPDPVAATGPESLRGVVVDGDGGPLAGLKLELVRLGKGLEMRQFGAISGSDGAIVWRGMPSGQYLPRGVGCDVVEPAAAFDFVATDTPPVLRFVCLLDLVLAGRVLDGEDRGVRGVFVIVEDRSGAEVTKIGTAVDGGFRVTMKAKAVASPEVRMWIFSYGRLAMTSKLEAVWGQTDLVLRVAPAPTGTLRVVAADGAAMRNYRLWIDLAPGARAASPWVVEGWIGFAPGTDPRLPGLGLVPQRLRIFPAEHRFACMEVDVGGGDACRDLRVQLPASAELLVRTVPPVAGARVHIVRVPSKGVIGPQALQPERMRPNPLREDQVVSLGDQPTDASGCARLRGGVPGEAVTVTVLGVGAAGECETVLAAYGEVLVPVVARAVLDVVLASAERAGEARGLGLQRLTSEGSPDRLGRVYPLAFGGEMPRVSMVLAGARLEQPLHDQVARALAFDDADAIARLSVDPGLPADVRSRLENISRRDRHRCHFDLLPPGRYRIARINHGEDAVRTFAEFTLAPGERAQHFLDLGAQAALDLKLQLRAGVSVRALVDEATGTASRPSEPRAGPTRLLALDADLEPWLSRDVAALPAHGVFSWTPDLAPMRIVLRLRTARGVPVTVRAVSRLAANEVTAGWHGLPLGQTDARGEVALRRSAMPFKLRVDGVATLLGPYAPDLRRHEQVIDVEVPER